MAAAFAEALGVKARLIAGGRGIFDVRIDGALRYSKHESGTFPDNEQLVRLIKSELVKKGK